MRSNISYQSKSGSLHQWFAQRYRHLIIALINISLGIALLLIGIFVKPYCYSPWWVVGIILIGIGISWLFKMKNYTSIVNPQSTGELWYLHFVSKSQPLPINLIGLIICAILLVLSIVKVLPEGFGYFGLILGACNYLWIERQFAYRIIKRQQDEIEKLKIENSANRKKYI